MRFTLLYAILLFTSTAWGSDKLEEPSDIRLVEYLQTLGVPGIITNKEGVISAQKVNWSPALERFSTEQLLEACKRIDINSSREWEAKYSIPLRLKNTKVSRGEYQHFHETLLALKKHWAAQDVASRNDGEIAIQRGDYISMLDLAIEAAVQRYKFRDTFALLNEKKANLTLMIVRFPKGDLKIVKPTEALIDDLLKASNPDTLPTSSSIPLRSLDDIPKHWDKLDLLNSRINTLEDGALIYLCDGPTVLAGIIVANSRIMYFLDASGPMQIGLDPATQKFVEFLRENSIHSRDIYRLAPSSILTPSD